MFTCTTRSSVALSSRSAASWREATSSSSTAASARAACLLASQALKVGQFGSLGQMVSLVPLLVDVGVEVLKSQQGLEVRRAHGPTCEYWLRPGPGPPPWTWPCPCPVAATVLLGATAEVGELVGATADVGEPAPLVAGPLVAGPEAPEGVVNTLVEDEPGGTAVVGVVMPCVADPGVIAPGATEPGVGKPGVVVPGRPRTWHRSGRTWCAPGVDPGVVVDAGTVGVVVEPAVVATGMVVVTHGTSLPSHTHRPVPIPPWESKSSCSRAGESMYLTGGMWYGVWSRKCAVRCRTQCVRHHVVPNLRSGNRRRIPLLHSRTWAPRRSGRPSIPKRPG